MLARNPRCRGTRTGSRVGRRPLSPDTRPRAGLKRVEIEKLWVQKACSHSQDPLCLACIVKVSTTHRTHNATDELPASRGLVSGLGPKRRSKGLFST